MTRETKIGLLVGLAFIIVIGILLSDHLSSSTEPPSATLVQAGTNVRQQVATPAGSQQPVQQFTTPAVVMTNPVATQRDLTPAVQPSAVVQVGPVTQANPSPIIVSKPLETSTPTEAAGAIASNTPTQEQPAVEPQQIETTPIQLANNSELQSPLGKLAAQHGEELIAPNGKPLSSLTPPKNLTQTASNVGGKDYVIQPGDSLSKLAGRFYGTNTKANRDLIIKANPSLAANPDKLIVGKSYKIPTAANVTAAVVAPAPSSPIAMVETAPVVTKVAPVQLASDTTIYYTVKPGDSLWKIASEQLGNGGRGVAAIKELNKDVLGGSDTVVVDMKLRMPGRAIASAN